MTEEKVRSFDTGATRSADAGRYDPESFLSPIVIERYCEYLNKHREQPDGSVRDPDNWQKGIPPAVYMKGLWRHMLHLWTRHRGFVVQDPNASDNIEEDLCAIIFGAQGYLFELLKEKRKPDTAGDSPVVNKRYREAMLELEEVAKRHVEKLKTQEAKEFKIEGFPAEGSEAYTLTADAVDYIYGSGAADKMRRFASEVAFMQRFTTKPASEEKRATWPSPELPTGGDLFAGGDSHEALTFGPLTAEEARSQN